MTENEIRNKVVNQAKAWLGAKESDGSHKKIIDVYNGHKPLARGYKVKYTDSWCATFVSAVAIKCGLTDIIPTECGCGEMINLFKALNAWKENDAYIPKVGDIIFYDWQDSGSGDNRGWSDHIGIVVTVSGKTITVIEGNNGDAVATRNITVNARYIRGYGVPNYASKTTVETKVESKVEKPTNEMYRVRKTWADAKSQIGAYSVLSNAKKKADANPGYSVFNSAGVKVYPEDKKTETVTSNNVVPGGEKARFKENGYSQGVKFKTTTALNMRAGAGTSKKIIKVLNQNIEVVYYGYYSTVGATKWYLVDVDGKIGFVSSKYLKRV